MVNIGVHWDVCGLPQSSFDPPGPHVSQAEWAPFKTCSSLTFNYGDPQSLGAILIEPMVASALLQRC